MTKRNKYGTTRVRDPHIPHGLTGGKPIGYWRERSRGLPVCDLCRRAWNTYCADYRFNKGLTKNRRGARS